MIRTILETYGKASGQLINFDKSFIVFGSNAPQDTRNGLASALGIQIDAHPTKYLGLPFLIRRNKREIFSNIRERVWQQIGRWKEKLLSQGEIEGIPSDYFWNNSDKKKIHWISWDKMCRSKKDRGMGFRKLHAFNLAMLTKQGWRILNNPDLLVSQILKARYFPNDEFLNAKKRSNISFTWRSILVARPVIERGVRWRIGDGRKVRAWKDPWIPRLHYFCLFTPQHIFMPDITVVELMNVTGRDWNLNILEALFCAEDVDMIKSIPLGNYALEDSRVWNFNKNGHFSVKSAYQVALPIVAHESRREVGESSAPTAGWNFI
ncbi:UNVERIFIED_CONTAM: putative ribonuclease H protein [Sesamum angustifolium]|uniref:Ribonuclease H protein n=1 Tax=Sesamum angustifolium TaxID=2727405 RepID=A0AAW2QT05_9LAMI